MRLAWYVQVWIGIKYFSKMYGTYHIYLHSPWGISDTNTIWRSAMRNKRGTRHVQYILAAFIYTYPMGICGPIPLLVKADFQWILRIHFGVSFSLLVLSQRRWLWIRGLDSRFILYLWHIASRLSTVLGEWNYHISQCSILMRQTWALPIQLSVSCNSIWDNSICSEVWLNSENWEYRSQSSFERYETYTAIIVSSPKCNKLTSRISAVFNYRDTWN